MTIRGMVSALAVAAVAGCSSFPDELEPSNWVSGASDWVSGQFSSSSDQAAAQQADQTPPPAPSDEKPKLGNDQRPQGEPTAERQQITEGLVADRTNAQYEAAEQKREGDPTRPLDEAPSSTSSTTSGGSAPSPAPSSSAAPVSTPAPVAAAPAPSASTKTLTSSDAAAPPAAKPQTPPAAASSDADEVVAPSARVNVNDNQIAATPAPQPVQQPTPAPKPMQVASAAPAPAPAPTPAPVAQAPAAAPAPAPAAVAPARPAVAAGNGDLVAATYQQRLAEFRSGSAAAAAPAARASYQTPSPSAADSISDSSAMPSTKVTAAHGSGGAHSLAAFDPSKAAASFQVAQVGFEEGTSQLRSSEEANLRAVAQLYRESKGAVKIGIIGHSDSPRLDVSAAANRDSNRSLAAERADIVARALEKMGVPPGRIYAGATGETAGDYVEVFAAY